ncbi:DUF3500 domain-containing protein [Snuella sedimenti]|uniref:DUF3500 domain-containing protein n=1 Tax=Snuella sedimenti TaxID=2798802 RepID=A0A8J7IG94_9FLAO|nr:DUF3500 domain-containing protein [Snuella sedimenti]MBJ6366526.1 DUF3500 domain-containing protein [Snuella sedimenti]
MQRFFLVILVLALPFSFYALQANDSNPTADFINALSEEQQNKIILDFNAPTKTSWHFFPPSMWPREGIPLGELTPEQNALLLILLRSYLSEIGYKKTMKIIDLENVLAELSGNFAFRDAKKYYTAFYGNPLKDTIWAWSFEGHHLSLNFTCFNNKISFTPRFFGANPATIKKGKRKGERTLHKEEDLGLKLINSMSGDQLQKAIFSEEALPDIVTSNAAEVTPLEAVGINMHELSNTQQLLLLQLINEYIASMPTALATKRMHALKQEESNAITFGWAGATALEKPHYYRIQGKTFLIEFDNTQNNANHIHTVWRDFNGDFGKDLIKEHYHKFKHQN